MAQLTQIGKYPSRYKFCCCSHKDSFCKCFYPKTKVTVKAHMQGCLQCLLWQVQTHWQTSTINLMVTKCSFTNIKYRRVFPSTLPTHNNVLVFGKCNNSIYIYIYFSFSLNYLKSRQSKSVYSTVQCRHPDQWMDIKYKMLTFF